MENEGSFKNKQIFHQFYKEAWQTQGVPQFNQHLLLCVTLLRNGIWVFLEINHQSGDFSLCRKASFLIWVNCVEWSDNSTKPIGCLDSHRIRPPWKHKGPHLPPLRVITSDCGHKVSLQTFLKDEALPRNPLLASLHILSSLLWQPPEQHSSSTESNNSNENYSSKQQYTDREPD